MASPIQISDKEIDALMATDQIVYSLHQQIKRFEDEVTRLQAGIEMARGGITYTYKRIGDRRKAIKKQLFVAEQAKRIKELNKEMQGQWGQMKTIFSQINKLKPRKSKKYKYDNNKGQKDGGVQGPVPNGAGQGAGGNYPNNQPPGSKAGGPGIPSQGTGTGG